MGLGIRDEHCGLGFMIGVGYLEFGTWIMDFDLGIGNWNRELGLKMYFKSTFCIQQNRLISCIS